MKALPVALEVLPRGRLRREGSTLDALRRAATARQATKDSGVRTKRAK